jgi:hypothetical protein
MTYDQPLFAFAVPPNDHVQKRGGVVPSQALALVARLPTGVETMVRVAVVRPVEELPFRGKPVRVRREFHQLREGQTHQFRGLVVLDVEGGDVVHVTASSGRCEAAK